MQIGLDLVHIPSFKKRLEKIELSKVFFEFELKQNKSQENLAGIFAAKEAFFKAYGKKVDWLDVWIEKNKNGKPEIKSSQTDKNISVSITHEEDFAAAIVIIF
jgi:holo-[acyl-carrier protein] synthase